MTKLTWKGENFDWNEACENCFQELKQRLTTTPIFVIPKSGERFTIYNDAFYMGLGCVLMQDGCVNAYASRYLKKHEMITLRMIWNGQQIWRHYLYDENVEIYTYYKSLKYLVS